MALFGKKKHTEEAAATAAPKKEVTRVRAASGIAHVLTQPRITEKASYVAADGVYVFDISEGATKRDIILAVKGLYQVTPRKVAVVTVKRKLRRNMRTGKVGVKKGGRKAYVYLKEGEHITIA